MRPTQGGNYRGRSMTLPGDVTNELRRLHDLKRVGRLRLFASVQALHDAGWTLSSISRAIGVSRERVRQMIVVADESSITFDDLMPIPDPPQPKPKPVKPPRWKPVPPDVTEQLRTLWVIARRVNGPTPADDPRRVASRLLNKRLVELVKEGYARKHLAEAMGVTHAAVTFRLQRAGYEEFYPSIKRKFLFEERQLKIGTDTHCVNGHRWDDDNLRFHKRPKGVKMQRYCRTCQNTAQKKSRLQKKSQ